MRCATTCAGVKDEIRENRPNHDKILLRTYRIAALPAVLVFRRGRLMFMSCALDDFGGADDFDEELVTRWLAKHDAHRTPIRVWLQTSYLRMGVQRCLIGRRE